MNTPNDGTSEAPVLKQAFTIKVIGVGGAGCNAVNHLARESFTGVSFAVMNTDAPALAQSPVATRLNLGAKTTRGLGAGGDPERGRAAADEDAAQIRALCEGADVVFVVAGMGGGTGTGASPVVARVAKEAGALVLSIVMLPFDCEGGRRARQAQLGLHELKQAADGVICLPNQRVFKLIDENTSLLEAFHITNELVAQGVRGIWRLLSRPGLINVDFADLCTVAQGKHSESCLVTAEAQGENRAREVMEKILAHPLIEGGQVLAESAGVLICIAGGKGITMAEVNRIMEQINRQCEHAHLILGAAVDEELGERLSVTLVASRRSTGEAGARGLELPSGAGRNSDAAVASAYTEGVELETSLQDPPTSSRSSSRFVGPPPSLSAEKTEQLLNQQNGLSARGRRNASRLKQAQLPLEIVSRGRFEKSEPTILNGQDLDMPTYLRRGVALN